VLGQLILEMNSLLIERQVARVKENVLADSKLRRVLEDSLSDRGAD